MCIYLRIDSSAREIEERFNVPFHAKEFYRENPIAAANDFPQVPILRKASVELFNWGLIPSHAVSQAQTRFLRINNQNARIESVKETRSYRDIIENRCLIAVNGFYTRNKKVLFMPLSRMIFTLAGLWDVWIDPETNETVNTFTVLTTEASENMLATYSEAARMPVVLAPSEESDWLNGMEIDKFADRSQIEIRAIKWEETI